MIFQKRDIQAFSAVRFKGPGNMTISQAESRSLIIHGPKFYLEKIRSKVVDGVLEIGYFPDTVVSLDVLNQQISYELKLNDLRKIDAAGSGNIDMPDLDVDILCVKVKGSGNISMGNLTADKLEIHLNGAGEAVIAGDVESQTIQLSGAGKYHAEALVSDFAAIKITGSGSAELSVSEDLQVQITGSGNVTYDGYPDVTRNISGSGKLSRKCRQTKFSSRSEEHG